MQALSTLPNFLIYLVSALACLLLFVTVYIRLTPFPEIKLIREGNHAAATAFIGALIGLYVIKEAVEILRDARAERRGDEAH